MQSLGPGAQQPAPIGFTSEERAESDLPCLQRLPSLDTAVVCGSGYMAYGVYSTALCNGFERGRSCRHLIEAEGILLLTAYLVHPFMLHGNALRNMPRVIYS
jgi:hypothetical protein